jgi:hydrogen peroxide-dependent heme synthase
MRHPKVPESLDSWNILHRMFRFDRRRWDAADVDVRARATHEAEALFAALALESDGDCGLVQLLGHKGDLMVTHYARSFDALGVVQAKVDKLALRDFLEPLGSYVSILELGLYADTPHIHAELAKRGLTPNAADWNAGFDEALAAAAKDPRNAGRLNARIPRRRYACFYPMNKRRAGDDNWYALSYDDRARMMVEHGKVGRTYAGLVNQVISGSIGFDDWEWGVDLYADDPLVFKKLVYEMRFDETSARYGEFGAFWTGVQFSAAALAEFLAGTSSPRLLATRPEPVLSGVEGPALR